MQSITETVIGEISRSLDFFAATSADSRIEKVYLTGGASRVSGLATAFAERTGLAVDTLNPLARMLPSSKYDQDYLDDMAPGLAVGVGLALRREQAQ
jgi:type IV pilus assembly protein PilM